METMQVEPVANGQQPMTSADVVCKVLYIYQGKAPSQGSGNNLFLKNVGIQTSFTRTETSVETMLREQLAAEQESSAVLIDQVDELKRKTDKTKRELEEYKKWQQEEYNNLCEICTRFSSSSKSQSSTPAA